MTSSCIFSPIVFLHLDCYFPPLLSCTFASRLISGITFSEAPRPQQGRTRHALPEGRRGALTVLPVPLLLSGSGASAFLTVTFPRQRFLSRISLVPSGFHVAWSTSINAR